MLTAGGASEALLLVDEPGAGLSFSPATQLACATPALGAAPGGCPITANGGNPYNGSAGHSNVFTGVVTGNQVTFFSVPIAQPGNNSPLIFRITNLRVNANGISGGPAPHNAVASVISSGMALPLSSNQLTVGSVEPGLYFPAVASPVVEASLAGCAAGQLCQVAQLTYQENFSTAFLTRVQNPIQNVPGIVYSSESGFFDPNWSTTNPSLSGTGQADSATRLKAEFTNIPAGAQVWVSAFARVRSR